MLLSISNASGQMVIQMEKDGGVYKIPCEINGLRLKLIFDTGASDVCISKTIALMMLDNGYLKKEDIKGSGSSVVADGRIVDNTIINIRELKIESLTLTNVEAVVMHQQSAPLLLGQSAIQKLGTVSIDGSKLILNQHSSDYDNSEYIQNLHIYAYDAYNNGYYELALPYFRKLYNLGYLKDIADKSAFAMCLTKTYQTSEAKDICLEMLSDVISVNDITEKISWLYLLVCNFYENENYIECITTGQRYLIEAQYNNCTPEDRLAVVFCMSTCYQLLGVTDKSIQHVENEIQKYLQFVQLKPTDCWDKHYENYYLGELYNMLSISYAYKSDVETVTKYLIIAAAWGNEDAISTANKHNIKYHQKPTKYSY